jgi:hypothetical protein
MYPFKTPHTQEFDLAMYFSDDERLRILALGNVVEWCEVEMRKIGVFRLLWFME